MMSIPKVRPASSRTLMCCALVLAVGVFAGGCNKIATLQGRVLDAVHNSALSAATVSVVGQSVSVLTDSTGFFSLDVSLTEDQNLQVQVSYAGYVTQTLTAQAKKGETVSLPAVQMVLASGGGSGGGGGGGTRTSGPASNIILIGASATHIGVRHSGDNENSIITFEVRDASGVPVDAGHGVSVEFSFTPNLSDSAFLDSALTHTDSSGRVSAVFNAGIRAGAYQVHAHVAATNIYSLPVVLAVHGGPPNVAHLSTGVETLNLPGLVFLGLTDRVTAFVGDRYGNPVPLNTVVYFSTTGGIMQGSGLTNDHGEASADLITAAPFPNDDRSIPAAYSDTSGLATITAQTVDEGRNSIAVSGHVMFSGHTELLVSPISFDIPLNGSQQFNVILRDVEHHNPLSGGTTVTVSATLGTLSGVTTLTLPDTQDRASTTFSFYLLNPQQANPVLVGPRGSKIPLLPSTDRKILAAAAAAARGAAPDGAQVGKPASITVSVTSQNGNTSTSILGTLEQ